MREYGKKARQAEIGILWHQAMPEAAMCGRRWFWKEFQEWGIDAD
jgi:hypothetical protein